MVCPLQWSSFILQVNCCFISFVGVVKVLRFLGCCCTLEFKEPSSSSWWSMWQEKYRHLFILLMLSRGGEGYVYYTQCICRRRMTGMWLTSSHHNVLSCNCVWLLINNIVDWPDDGSIVKWAYWCEYFLKMGAILKHLDLNMMSLKMLP